VLAGGRATLRRLSVALTGLVVAVPLTVLLTAPPAGAADEPMFVPWSAVLPGWTDEFEPSSENDCVAGRDSCLRHTLKELGRVFEETGRSCDHNAVFALAYLRITQTYGWSRDVPGYYQDVPFANHQDAVFARFYTDAYHAWRSGDLDRVPTSWRIAFDAARDRAVSGTGDLLLGMNAHINRDLPFVVAAVGLVAPDGSSRKPDYDKVEHFLNLATEPMLAEAAARFDPRLDDAHDPLGLGQLAAFQLISAWRESAWRNAERLVSARTPEEREQVAASIEAAADATARSIRLSQAYAPPLTTTGSRDTWCATHRDAAAPSAYPFGSPQPWGPYGSY
jgi:hypothetical protein